MINENEPVEKYKEIRRRALAYKERQKKAEAKGILRKISRWKQFKKKWSNIPYWLVGSRYDVYARPQLTTVDMTFILINIHLNLRTLCRFIDHTIKHGPLFVSIFYTVCHCAICPPLAFVFGFLGRYGERSFLSTWQLCPIMRGISVSACLIECYKMIETSLLISSAMIMLVRGYYTEAHMFSGPSLADEFVAGRLICNTTNEGKPLGVHYGLSKLFTEIGYTPSNPAWLLPSRVHVMIAIWCLLVSWRFFSLTSLFIKRISPIIVVVAMLVIIIGGVIGASRFDIYTNVPTIYIFDILHMVTFAVGDYLPTHWITLGFVKDKAFSKAQIIGIVITSAATGVGMSWAMLSYMDDYAKALEFDKNCVTTYGLEFFMVVIPYSLRYHWPKLGVAMIHVYIVILVLMGLTYIYTNHMLLLWAFESWRQLLFRFRHVFAIITLLTLGACAVLFCTPTCHDFLIELNEVVLYHGQIVVFICTLTSIGIYGLWHLSADCQYSEGNEYQTDTLKFLLIFNLVAFILYGLSLLYDYSNIFNASIEAAICLTLILAPLILTAIIVMIIQKAYYHGLFYRPLPTWGSANEQVRDLRRLHNLRRMVVTRRSRDCDHNCLRHNRALESEVYEELRMRRELLEEIDDALFSASTTDNNARLSRASRASSDDFLRNTRMSRVSRQSNLRFSKFT